jgi:hypothetical protein
MLLALLMPRRFKVESASTMKNPAKVVPCGV